MPPVNASALSSDELAAEVRSLLASLQNQSDVEARESRTLSTVEITLGLTVAILATILLTLLGVFIVKRCRANDSRYGSLVVRSLSRSS